MNILKDLQDGFQFIIVDPRIHTVAVFCAPLSNVKKRVQITRNKRSKNTYVVDIGRPNYEQRQFLKLCKKARTKPRRFWYKFLKNAK